DRRLQGHGAVPARPHDGRRARAPLRPLRARVHRPPARRARGRDDDAGLMDAPRIALIGTLDTKAEEVVHMAGRLAALGVESVVVDSGILGAPAVRGDIPREEVAAAGGHTLARIRAAGSRGAAVELMRDGVRAVVLDLHARGRIRGALALGGAEGA